MEKRTFKKLSGMVCGSFMYASKKCNFGNRLTLIFKHVLTIYSAIQTGWDCYLLGLQY